MGDFKMPSLGADMEDGTLVEWLVKPGDVVKKGDIIAVVETQKGAIEIETFDAGAVAELRVAEGQKVPVGTVLARIGPAPAASGGPAPAPALPAEPVSAPVSPAPQAAARAPAPPPTPEPPPAPTAPPSSAWVRSSPAARRRAFELGIALTAVRGTGPHGAVTRKDVEDAAVRPAPAPIPEPAPAPPAPSGMRQAIAAAMSRSNREIPHYYLSHHVDMRAALAFLEKRNRDRSIEDRVLPAVLPIRAVALALAKHPELNGFWEDGAFRPGDGVHLGIAVHLRAGGLVIPAIRDADRKDLEALMADLTDLVGRARAGRLRAGELSSATATLSSLGERGVEAVFGVIYPPQVALIGVGATLDRPWAVDGMLTVRPVAQLTLAADHRASDGHAGSRFLERVASLLGNPEKL